MKDTRKAHGLNHQQNPIRKDISGSCRKSRGKPSADVLLRFQRAEEGQMRQAECEGAAGLKEGNPEFPLICAIDR